MEEFNNNNKPEQQNEFNGYNSENSNENPANNGGGNSPYADVNPYENPNPYTSNFNPYTTEGNRYASDYGVSPERKERKGLGIAGMILGILSLIFCCVWYLSLPCAIIGLILSIVSQKAKSNGFALSGIIMCGFGLAFALLITISTFALFGSFIEEFMKAFESALESISGDSSGGSSFDHNNGAIVNLFNFIKGILKR